MKKHVRLTEQDLLDDGYVYVKEVGINSRVSNALQLWKGNNEVIIYEPYSQTILLHKADRKEGKDEE